MLWVIEPDRETTTCPRCQTRHQVSQLKFLAESEDEAAIRDARAQLLANRSNDAEAFDQVDSYATLEATVYEDVVDDRTYLTSAGVDPAAAEAAASTDTTHSQSQRETVLTALRTLEEPTEAAIVAYASDRGVSEDYVTRTLEKLVTAGEVIRDGETYRLV